MKKSSIISVGTEIMKGKIDDTNSTYISRWLDKLGILVKWRLSVSDDINDIVESLNAVKESDIIILTGGLGPTDDDCTREGIAKFLGKELVFNEDAWMIISNFFKRRNYEIPLSNKKQAMIIPGGEFIKNDSGTAPGIFYKENNKIYVLLPGPPNENQKMINESLFDRFKDNGLIEGEIISKVIRVYNVGESELADKLSQIKTKCQLGYYFSQNGWVELHISYYSINKEEAIQNVNKTFNDMEQILLNNNYFYTFDKDLGTILFELLKEKKLTISFAESITGGNISGEFVKNPGASEVLLGGIVAYSNEIKTKLLNVSQDTLNKFGAVSEECAKEMVIGLKDKFNSDISVSITGIAGPTGASKEKPLGLVYFGFIIDGKTFIKKEIFFGKRERIIKRSINYAFIDVYKNIIKKDY